MARLGLASYPGSSYRPQMNNVDDGDQRVVAKAQYTPPTRLNCRVELRRRCVLNSQLVGDSLDESEQFADNEVELRRVSGVNAPVVSLDPVSNFLRQS